MPAASRRRRSRELLADVRSRFPVVTESHPLGEEAGRLAAWFTERALA